MRLIFVPRSLRGQVDAARMYLAVEACRDTHVRLDIACFLVIGTVIERSGGARMTRCQLLSCSLIS